jgi:tetratricopeptide (TPR) repeat protein
MAESLTYSGKPAEAIGLAEKGMRLDPRNPEFYLGEVGRAYDRMGRYAEAVPFFKSVVARYPDSYFGHINLVTDYTELGREADARAEAAEVMRISPNFSVERVRETNPDMDRAWVERRLADQRKAGLK